MIVFSCAHCGFHLTTKQKNKGRQFQCPKCDHLVSVPSGDVETEHGHTWDTHVISSFVKNNSTTERKKRGHGK